MKDVIEGIKGIVGPKGYMDDPRLMAPYLADWRGRYQGNAPIVVMPSSTYEVSEILILCNRTGTPVVPQGGNTGLVLGGVPTDDGTQIVINLSRMNKVLDVDVKGLSMTVEAGASLHSIQQAAKEHGLLFPLSLASEGTCQIGGNISTNAGGIHVLRYGNTRELILGLEAVLPTGEVWNGMTSLRKDNTGYDLKQLFIGAEGTLGIVTQASLKLYPAPKTIETAFIGMESVEAAMTMLETIMEGVGERLTAFEIMPRAGIEKVLKHIPDTRDPLATPCPWYAVIDLWSVMKDDILGETFANLLAECMEKGLALDAAYIQNETQRADVWKLRETFAEALKKEGAGFAFDISVPVSKIPSFINEGIEAVSSILPGAISVPFGHAGDGNIHFNIGPGTITDMDVLKAKAADISTAINDIAVGMGGSISAEHGIGRYRKADLNHYKDPLEMNMMKAVKKSLDPNAIMNPGVFFDL